LSFAKTQPAWSKSPIHENAPPQLRVRPTSGKKIDAPAMEEKDFLRAAYHSDLDLRSKATDPRVHAVSGVLPCYRFQGLPHGPPRQSAQPMRRGRMIGDIEEECSPLPILWSPIELFLPVGFADSIQCPRLTREDRKAKGAPWVSRRSGNRSKMVGCARLMYSLKAIEEYYCVKPLSVSVTLGCIARRTKTGRHQDAALRDRPAGKVRDGWT
jgi:hypothetical protein